MPQSANAQTTDALAIDDQGDVGIGTTAAESALHIRRTDGTAKLLVEESSETPAVRELFELRNNGGPFFILKNLNKKQSYAFAMIGARFIINHQQESGIEFQVDPFGNVTLKGALTENSSRSVKQEIEPVEPESILERVMELTLSEWSYRHDPRSVRHVGPMAEEFWAKFGLGTGNQGISTLDTSGVALAAVQGLHRKIEDRDARIAALETSQDTLSEENAALKAEVAELRHLVESLSARHRVATGRSPK